ncbi:MAG: ATP synthase F0 subunit B [Chloroflexi bacterium CG15_BIG_FIL_POST_REV_8_21_14_020_46_15]|nr:MAG: ATP synthase F0 subunit B [Dehalococcoidia bacterium CG2_30_46_19]PIW40144.1 MAG: ATP synthase F0 subunit B [Chloroflexi bacterium CG15_BIG_FIL_POST_REV_8_21_14_020_46_15]
MEGLGLDLPTFVGQLVSFLILLGLLVYVGYKPIRKMLDERANRIKESMEQAEATKQEYEQAKVAVQEQIGKAREEGQAIISQAAQIGDRLKEEARGEARKEAQALVERARGELERERDKVIDDLRHEFVDTAILAAEKVINETLDKERHRKLIEQAMEESTTFKEN